MNAYFYSLGMLVTGRGWHENPNLTAMDLLANAIADEERAPHPLLTAAILGQHAVSGHRTTKGGA